MSPTLPQFAPFPPASLIELLDISEWRACLEAWIGLAQVHLALSEDEFTRSSVNDESLSTFLVRFVSEVSTSGRTVLRDADAANLLCRATLLLTSRCLSASEAPPSLLQWDVLSDFAKLHGRRRARSVFARTCPSAQAITETSLSGLKKFLVKNLEAGLRGDLKGVEARLNRVNYLIDSSPESANFLLAGSDFMDALVDCYKIMNPPLRKAIITTTFLCHMGLTDGSKPRFSMLTDQLFSLKAAADAHKLGPLNVNDSLVAELVTATPLLQQLEKRMMEVDALTGRAKSALDGLASFRKPGGGMKPRRTARRKVDKGKGVAHEDDSMHEEIHMHRMSQISQIQDLFPDLGSAFVSRLLDAYEDDSEQVIAHLLEGTLPSHLQAADRSSQLETEQTAPHVPDLAPHSTPQLPSRRNVFDDDELDRLAVDTTSRLHFGKRNPEKTADALLADKSTAPNKAAILSALATFDSDDDERDDTYDAVDVGGTIDDTVGGEDTADSNDEVLYKAFQSGPKVFGRDAITRRDPQRLKLKEETGMTDEAIEGWALMFLRNPQKKRRLDAKFSMFAGVQPELDSTKWKASPAGSGAEDSDSGPAFRGGRGRGRGRGPAGGGRGGGRGDVTPDGKETEQARRRKEANKSSRANHNRRDQRARKFARGGFPG